VAGVTPRLRERAEQAEMRLHVAPLNGAAGSARPNRSGLLRGVNDSVAWLAELSETLFAVGVLPYYLHVLDRVRGAAHFDVPEATALALHAGLTARLPGYLVPRLVREVPGADAKTMLQPASR